MPKKMPSREERFKQIAKMEKEQKYYADRRVQIVKERLKCHKFIGEYMASGDEYFTQSQGEEFVDACGAWGSYHNPELTQPKGKELNS